MHTQIAILGWGSLLWDAHPAFDNLHDDWKFDGPLLKLEFSRVSKSRRGALTLVIDPINGEACHVAYTRSKRNNPEDAMCDLQSRESTIRANIGFFFADRSRTQSRSADALRSIEAWAKTKTLDVVIWTDLASNFQCVTGDPFSVHKALAYLQSLPCGAKNAAFDYILRAPAFIDTPLRRAFRAHLKSSG